MKKFLLLSLVAIMSLATVSCKKNEISVSFAKGTYVLMADAALEVELTLSPAPEASVDIPIEVLGNAVENEDYIISSKLLAFNAGDTKATIAIAPKDNFDAGKAIQLVLGQLPAGYIAGAVPVTTIAVEKKEAIIYSFETETTNLLDTYTIKLKLVGESTGEDFTMTADTEIPFVFADGSNAVEGEHFEVVGGNKVLTVKAGTNVATVVLKALELPMGADELVVKMAVDKEALNARYLEGDIPEITLNIKGVLKFSSLVGTWEFVDNVGNYYWSYYVESEGDDPDLCPWKNDGYQVTFEVSEDGVCTFTPGDVKGDLSNFFREAVVDYIKPYNIIDVNKYELLGDYCTEEMNMFQEETVQLTYFSLDKANRKFSATEEDIKPSAFALRLDDNGVLEIHLRDYDKPPFMHNWWNDSKFHTEMFGFIYQFEKIK